MLILMIFFSVCRQTSNILHNAENHFIFFIIRHYAIQITFLILQINLILHQIPFKSQYTRQTVIIHDLRYRFPDQAPLFRHIEQFGRRLIHLNDLQIIIHSYQKSGQRRTEQNIVCPENLSLMRDV